MMDEGRYLKLAADAFKRIEDAFDDVDPALADLAPGGDVLTISFQNGLRCVVNTQRPARQIWLAAKANAYHFGYDEPSARWMDDRGRGIELMKCLADIVLENAGLRVALGA